MTGKPSLTDVSLATPKDGACQEIQRLVQEKLAGRQIDGVAFLAELLPLAQQVGEVRCEPAGNHGLRFELRGREPFEVALDANRGKLRMLCARLAVLCQEGGHEFLPYGGEGSIRQAGTADANPDGRPPTWKAHWINTPGRPEFTIQYQPE